MPRAQGQPNALLTTDDGERAMPEEIPAPAILLCHIAWMRKYRGDAKDKPVGGGSHPEKEESLNYKVFNEPVTANRNPSVKYMYGYVASSKAHGTRIIRLERLGAAEGAESVPAITVVWTATRPGGGRYVVGWYRNATVYRELQRHPDRGWYNVRAAPSDCILIKPSQRCLNIESGLRGRPQRAVWFPPEDDYGAEVRREVGRLIRQEFDIGRLNRRTAELVAYRQQDAPPPGVRVPISQRRKITVLGRDPEVRAYVLARAAGTCERCDKRAPFNGPSGDPFLEVHHVQQLADGGPDTTDNAVALCPNCHREAHFGVEKNAVSKKLRDFLCKTGV